MKSLSLQRPLILMIIGIPGSGKSFFARQFAETFHAPLVNTDFIRACVSNPVRYDRAEQAIIDTIADQQIRELLKTHKTFLVDGGLNVRADRFALEKLAREYDFATLTIWVQTDQPTSLFRATKRNPKRPGDAYNASITSEQFASLAKQLTVPSAQEPFIVISGKHTYATQAKAVLKKIMPMRQASPSAEAYSAQTYDQPQTPKTTPNRRNVIIN